MQLTIDNRTVTARSGESILQCALRHEISIPHLCTHPNLPAFGACRLCLVEVDGMRGFPTSCTTPAADGMVVRTNTEALQDLRRRILQLILLEHPSACLVCDKQELCEKYRPSASKAGRTTGCHTCNNKEVCEVRVLSDQLHLTELPIPSIYRNLPLDRSDPFIDRDLNLCILCGRCVRICKSHHGWSTIDFIGRGSTTHIGEAFGRSLSDAGCRFCGSCVDVCPTGSLSDRYAKWYGAARRNAETTCLLCDAACALRVAVSSHNRAVACTAVNTGVPICVLGRFAIPEFLNAPKRLRAPRMRVGNVQREVAWPEALAAAAERLRPFAGGAFACVCDASSTLEDRHVLRRFTREVMDSPHYVEAEPAGHGPARVPLPAGIRAALVTGPFVERKALEGLDVLIVQDCHPSAASELAHVLLPAAVLLEVSGTCTDSQGKHRAVRQACDGPGEVKPDWQIACELARAMGAEAFAYDSAAAIAAEIGVTADGLWIARTEAPLAATDPRQRRTHFRGHRLEDTVGGLRDLCLREPAPAAAAVGA